MRSAAVLCLTAVACAVSGCAHKPPVPEESAKLPPAPPAEVAAPAPLPAPPEPVAERACSTDGDCSDGSLCSRGRCVAIGGGLAECAALRVHFDFDSTLLRADDRPALERIARCLRAASGLHVTIEGNADERGTEEYNLQLGQRRAVEVERYLVALGVRGDQLKTISYGYEKPLCREHTEVCWAQNRRAAVQPEGLASSR
jgi:peptidoglycan-associated lipoprotein